MLHYIILCYYYTEHNTILNCMMMAEALAVVDKDKNVGIVCYSMLCTSSYDTIIYYIIILYVMFNVL